MIEAERYPYSAGGNEMNDPDDRASRPVERGPAQRTRAEQPRSRGRNETAPIESVAGHTSPPSGGWRAHHGSTDRARGDTAELIPPMHEAGIGAPLGLDDHDPAIERTFGFDEIISTFDDMKQAELDAAVARSLADEQAELDAMLDPTATADFEAGVARRYRDVPLLAGPEATVDFGDSLDASLDQAIDDAPLRDNPTSVDFPRPATRPLGGMDPSEWAAHVLMACRSLASSHAEGQTFDGRFDLDEQGVAGTSRAAAPGSDSLVVDVRRMHHLIGVLAEAVRAGADNSPTSMVVADALTEVKPADSAAALARGLLRALSARTVRQRKRLEAEFEAVDARRRALATQRRLRADLAARMARLDASISAQAAAVARDEDRVQMLAVERASLDDLIGLVGVDAGEEAPEAARAASPPADARSAEETRSDKVRRLLGA